jgi:hypothetical protein
MAFRKRVHRFSLALSLCAALLLVGAGLVALVHCHGEHAHGGDVGHCALCAFACHVAAVFLSILSFACLPLVRPLRLARPNRRVPYSYSCPHPIRAPPLLLSTTRQAVEKVRLWSLLRA